MKAPIFEVILSMILLGAITFIYRYSFIGEQGRKFAEKIPKQFLDLMAPAIFSAIIVNSTLASSGGRGEDLKLKGIVLLVALPFAYFTRSVFGTLVAGLGLLYVLQNFI